MMGLAVTEDRITSNNTPHTATRRGGKWVVSWLPGRQLGRNEALAAMHLAWYVALDASVHGSYWPLIVADAGELGMSGQEAVKIIAAAPAPGKEER